MSAFSHLPGHLTTGPGPMFANKTGSLVDNLNRYADLGFSTVYINTIEDTRSDRGISTHNSGGANLSEKVTKISTNDLAEVDVSQFKVIGVDEAQFFPKLCDTVLNWVDEQGKIVHAVGLDLNAKRERWGELTELSAHADVSIKMTAKCLDCLAEGQGIVSAPFTSKINLKAPDVDIGGSDKYVPCCRKHWNTRNTSL